MDAFRSAVRPVVTLALVGALIYGFIAGSVQPESFITIVTGVVAWWFAARTLSKKE